MKIWIEIEYTRKEDGDLVHSDFGHVEEEESWDLLEELLGEIMTRADLSKPWSLHSNGEDK